jgi:hypothetical protein
VAEGLSTWLAIARQGNQAAPNEKVRREEPGSRGSKNKVKQKRTEADTEQVHELAVLCP